MNRHILLLVFLMTIAIPGVVYSSMQKWKDLPEEIDYTTETEIEEGVVSVLAGENVFNIDLEAYVQCVILGEIPASFEMETLKAQAVATRTYTLKHMSQTRKHDQAFLCTDSTCCQAFCNLHDYLNSGGSQEDIDRIQEAVMETRGEVLYYDRQLIDATYFAASGGRTEAAVEVWGADVPYLQSVDSPAEQAYRYENCCTQFSHQEFLEKLELPIKFAERITCNDLKYTKGGGVASVTVCGEHFTGKEIRERLKLPSTVFGINVGETCITVTTNGNGHRVGMSQYGADAMAAQGKMYTEILAHYYPGTNVHQMTREEIEGVFDKAGIL